uniref:Secreted protein n=1 Tax=Ixodes ricinus TaxID=34613 RepID=A0A6B0UY45_IXORI
MLDFNSFTWVSMVFLNLVRSSCSAASFSAAISSGVFFRRLRLPAAKSSTSAGFSSSFFLIPYLSRICCLIFSRSSSIRRCFSFRLSSASRSASSRSCSASASASLSSEVSPSPPIWPLTALSLLPIICFATNAAMVRVPVSGHVGREPRVNQGFYNEQREVLIRR